MAISLSASPGSAGAINCSITGMSTSYAYTRSIWWQAYYSGSKVAEKETTVAIGEGSSSTSITGLTPGETYTIYAYIYSGRTGSLLWSGHTDSLAGLTTYKIIVKYNANGGSGAPSLQTFTSNSLYVSCTISSTVPTKSGKDFVNWKMTDSSSTEYYFDPGLSTALYGTTSGVTYTLYALWQDTGFATPTPYIYLNGSWRQATVYIYSNGWKTATPKIWNR